MPRHPADKTRSGHGGTAHAAVPAIVPADVFAGLPPKYLLSLLLFVPISSVLARAGGHETLVFIMAALSIIPLAATIAASTEELAKYLGTSFGALLNATFGNAAELILTIGAVAHGELVLVRASITGSIIANILLGFGAAMLLGGLRHRTQRFKHQQAELLSTMLLIAVIAIVTPSMFDLFLGADPAAELAGPRPSRAMVWASVLLSGALLLLYVLSLVFSFWTHKEEFVDEEPEVDEPAVLGRNTAGMILLVCTCVMAWQTDVMLDALTPALKQLDLSKLFVGVILLPLLGNLGEYFSGISAALKNRIGVAAGIAIGASNQVIFFVLPVLIFVSMFLGHPMPFILDKMEILAVTAAALIVNKVTDDGQTNWLEGAQLIVIWCVLAIAFYFLS
jgi:Ca2+:H+ antiporter